MTEAAASTYIGQPLRRREDFKFITGKGRYVDDIKVPGMLHMAMLRSPHAHAVIKRIDLAAAKAAPGVRVALSGADLVGKIGPIVPNWIMPGTKVPERPVVAIDRVRFVGECVALVVAQTQAMAYDAVGLIDVEYEALPAVVDEEQAIQAGAPQLHENVSNNITTVYKIGGGDYRKAVREADQVISLRVVNNRLIPTCMETRSILAVPNADETLTVYMPSQVPHMHRRFIADTVGIPEHHLRIIAPDIGGGFGAKMHLYPEELLCPFLARMLGLPVKWWESRSESHQSTTHGRAHTEAIEIAIRNDGKILGMKVETLGNVGAYLSNMASGGPTVNTINFGTGTYKIENYEAISRVVVTNTVPVDAYRGYGRPEGGYIAERAIDAVARHLNLDQVEVRRKNFIQKADFPYKPYNGPAVIYDSGNYQGCLEAALQAFNYAARMQRTRRIARAGSLPRHRRRRIHAYVRHGAIAPTRADRLRPRRLGEFARQRGFERPRDHLFWLDESRSRPRHVAGADRRRCHADANREHRRCAGGYTAGSGRPRYIQLSLDGRWWIERSRLCKTGYRQGKAHRCGLVGGGRKGCLLSRQAASAFREPTLRR